MKTEKILIVDDDPKIIRLVCNILEASGYRPLAATSGKSALETLALENPDLIILDIMLPHENGYDICRTLREFSSLPVIMLTSKVQEADKIKGFESGADDYLTKPFSAKELLARIKAVLRRSKSLGIQVQTRLSFGKLELDLARHKLTLGSEEIKLTPTEFKLLRYLALNAEKVLTHEELLTEIWGTEYRNDIDYLRTYIKNLRKKTTQPGLPQGCIKTISGVGYIFSSATE